MSGEGRNRFGEDEEDAVATATPSSAASPYHAPAVDSYATQAPSARLPHVRIPAPYALLIVQAPIAVAAIADLVAYAIESTSVLPATVLFVASFDAILFNIRTAFIGPGRLVTRASVAVAALCGFALYRGWYALATGTPATSFGFRDLNAYETIVETGILASVLVPAAAFIALLGSRDRAIRGGSASWRADWIVAGISGAVCAAAVVPILAGVYNWDELTSEWTTMTAGTRGSIRPFLAGLVGMALWQTWRVGCRGFDRFFSRKFAAFATVVLAAGAVVVAIARTGPPPPGGDVGWMAFAISVVGIPVARELFLRFAGYRAKNVYWEWWKTRRARRRAEIAAATEATGE